MKISKVARKRIELDGRQINAVEQRIRSIIDDYGFEPYRYISNKIMEGIRQKRRLTKEISEREKELEELKGKV